MTLTSINPATENILNEYEEDTREEVDRTLSRAVRARENWENETYSNRASFLSRTADLLHSNRDEYASLMTREMGKPISESRSEVEKCAWVCEHYAENAESYLRDEVRESDASKSYVTYRPLGVVLAIMPWNFPFWQVFRFAVPSLMAGNGAVLKHASNVTGCALALEEIFREAGFPESLFSSLVVGSERVDQIIQRPEIKAVTLTGSTPAGRSVSKEAGANLKKCVLELGGSDPYLILEDADLEHAAETCVTSRLINTGQSCIAAKRLVVHESVQEEFTNRVVRLMKDKTMGDPTSDVDLGPLARMDLRDTLHEQVLKSIDRGAELLAGGEIPKRDGAFYPPTVLKNVKTGMPAYEEELFGPVAVIITAESEEEAIEIANDTPFGLGAAVFTENEEKGERIAAEELQAGCCFVNDFVRSDPRLPFGGVKDSGFGRELSREGILEFVNRKTVYIR